MQENVLIVGAGPTGLTLALWLTQFGIPVRIIDKDSGPGQTSRAMVVHARTLEFYQQIGIAAEVVAKGIIVDTISIRSKGSINSNVALGPLGKNLSPFPFVLSLPQDDHEKILIAYLKKANVSIERNTELESFSQDGTSVLATLKKQNETEITAYAYLFGCDGARSTVREQAGIGFPGGTYQELFYVADVMATGDVVNGQLQLCFNEDEFSLVFPVRSSGSVRLIGIVPKQKRNKDTIEFSDVESSAVDDTKITITKENWFSTYHSHHRVAEQFRKGRIFLLGDAGHIHSPVGGQGMNTGIGDAINLAWKIAAVMQNRAAESILDSFAEERIGFARQLVKTTDKVFQAVTNPGFIGTCARRFVFPYLLPFLLRFMPVKHFFFNTVSQIKIKYPRSPLSKGSAGSIKAGDRLPWLHSGNLDNYKTLELLDWQIHIYGKASLEVTHKIDELGLKAHEFAWNNDASEAGFEQNALYLIRPDGYIAYANRQQSVADLEHYLMAHKISSRKF